MSTMSMSTMIQKIDAVEHWWWDLPSHYQWFVATIPAAVLLGLAAGVLRAS
jgi:hypothetical protein